MHASFHQLVIYLWHSQCLYARISKLKHKYIAHIIKMWKAPSGKTPYWIRYSFIFKNIQYRNNAQISYNDYTQYTINSQLSILFDPKNPTNNILHSVRRRRSRIAVFVMLIGIIWISTCGWSFGIMCQWKWDDIILKIFAIPAGAFIILSILICLCWKVTPSYCRGRATSTRNLEMELVDDEKSHA